MLEQNNLCRVKVAFVGVLHTTFGVGDLVVEIPNQSTVRELLEELSKVLEKNVGEQILDQSGGIDPAAVIMVNEFNAKEKEGLDTRITGEANVVIALIPQLSGG